MRVPRSTNFLFVSCIFSILLPFTLPNFIMTLVVIILRTSFWAVPDFIRVLPVTNSGPTITSMGISACSATGEFGLQVIQAVRIPFSRQCFSAPITYGVVPDAAIPITVSFLFILCSCNSCQPLSVLSSAASTGLRKALSPPAISPMTKVLGIP